MRPVDIIAKKRDGGELTSEEIDFFIGGYTRGEIPDYQAAAWAMAVLLRGMSQRETADLTLAMARSGVILDLKDVAPFVVDKHSSGGVGDKTTLVVAPLIASLGLPVGKMSGRGLGFSGGTVDKLEAIRGYRVDLGVDEFKALLREHGIVVSAQSPELAPADGKLYALRDVTATVDSLPLIASSIMSKKIAAGADAIVLDVKVGRGAFTKTEEEALALAQTMVEIGRNDERQVVAVISRMDQPLGNAAGNALEVQEAIETLRGGGPADFRHHCLVIASQMLLLAAQAGFGVDGPNRPASAEEAERLLSATLDDGRAWAKFREWIAAQGGDLAMVDDPSLLPRASLVETVPAPQEGYLAAIDAREVGWSVVDLGGGRARKGDPIDYGVGVVLHKKLGDRAEKGEPLFTIHANDSERLGKARERLLAAIGWSSTPVMLPPHAYQVIS
jgi:pyrimidine-nucleoside phosphorylase